MAWNLHNYAHYLKGIAVGTFRGLDLKIRTDVEVSVDDEVVSITLTCLDSPPLVISRKEIEDNMAERMVIAHFMLLPYFQNARDTWVAHPVLEAIKRLKK